MTRFLFRTLAAAAAVLLCAPVHAAAVHRYEVSVDSSLERIAVHACFDARAPETLVAESDGARFYLESMRIGERQIEPAGDKVVLNATGENTCVDYQVKLQPSQTSVQAGGPETRRVGSNMLTSIGDWLWRPQEPGADIELTFRLPSGVEVSAPWQRKAGSEGRPVFLAGATPYNWAGIVAFGYFTPRDIEVPGAILHVAVLNAPEVQRAQLEKWIENTARNVTLLYGRFPVASLQVVVAPTPRGRGPVPWAYVARGGGPGVHLFINMARPAEEFERDWSLTHEMSHLFLPYVVSRDAWLYEGVPTYLQNVLMARGGAISVEQAWQRMRSGFQSGERNAPQLNLARANERVANGAYLRVYWAGAAMMLDADLRLREQTGGKQSLGSALEQMSSCCAAQARRWTAQEIIARLDELTGTTIFGDLVRSQFESNAYPDYEAVLKRAGITVDAMEVELDAAAPWATQRDALMQPGH